MKALTAARATEGKRVTKDECEELLYKIHAEQREKYVGSTSVEDDKSVEGDSSSGAETAGAEVVARDAEKSKEVKTRRRPRTEKSSLSESMRTVKSANKSRKKEARRDDRITYGSKSQSSFTSKDEDGGSEMRPAEIKHRMAKSSPRPKGLSESMHTVKRANKSSKKEARRDDKITYGSKSQASFASKDEDGGSSDKDSRQEELSQLLELKLQLAKQQELIDSLNAKLSSMSKVQERNNDLERENDVLWKKVTALQSARNNQGRSVTQSNGSVEQSAGKNQCRSAVDKTL